MNPDQEILEQIEELLGKAYDLTIELSFNLRHGRVARYTHKALLTIREEIQTIKDDHNEL